MGWLAPAWLVGFVALAIPIIIHLRRRRIGRRVLVGSVRHLSGSATPRSRRLRVRNPWLLLLRLAVLSALVLALAGPLLSRVRAAPRHWTLIAPELARDTAFLHHDPLLDSLKRAGGEQHLLAPGLPALTDGGDAGSAENREQADLWSLLREADGRLPDGSSITVVTPARLALATGTRPPIAAAVALRSPAAPPAAEQWVDAGWGHGDSVAIRVGTSERGAAAYAVRQMRIGDAATVELAGADVRIVRNGDAGWRAVTTRRAGGVRGGRGGADTIAIPRIAPLAVSIATSRERTGDAAYLSAAFAATAAVLELPIVPGSEAGAAASASSSYGAWVVRLGLPADSGRTEAAPGGAMLYDAAGGAESSAGVVPFIVSDGSALPAGYVSAGGSLNAGGNANPGSTVPGRTLLTLANGTPLLTARRAGPGTLLSFRGRFDPASSDLVLRPAFPELIARLWAGTAVGLDRAPRREARAISLAQLLPRHAPALPRAPAGQSLRDVLLATAAALFLLERLVAHRTRR